MKKTVTIIALFALFIISVSANADRVVQAAEGCVAPAIELTDSANTKSDFHDFKGKWTLINFWDSCDPVSRMAAADYDELAETMRSDNSFNLLSINLDSDSTLYSEISRRDGLTEGIRLNIDPADASRLTRDYYLDRGRNSYLVGPEGVILAVNPTAARVKELILTNS